jgi:alkylated DNA repair protein alkB family protein 6
VDEIKNIPGGVANMDLVGDAEVLDGLRDGTWSRERGERISLTFRHANKVVKGGALGMAMNAMRRP